MNLETAFTIIEKCPGFDDETSSVGEAWAFIKEQKQDTLKKLEFGDTQIIIIPSNWIGRYHVITEDPTEGDWAHEHEFLSKQQVCLRYDLKPEEVINGISTGNTKSGTGVVHRENKVY